MVVFRKFDLHLLYSPLVQDHPKLKAFAWNLVHEKMNTKDRLHASKG